MIVLVLAVCVCSCEATLLAFFYTFVNVTSVSNAVAICSNFSRVPSSSQSVALNDNLIGCYTVNGGCLGTISFVGGGNPVQVAANQTFGFALNTTCGNAANATGNSQGLQNYCVCDMVRNCNTTVANTTAVCINLPRVSTTSTTASSTLSTTSAALTSSATASSLGASSSTLVSSSASYVSTTGASLAFFSSTTTSAEPINLKPSKSSNLVLYISVGASLSVIIVVVATVTTIFIIRMRRRRRAQALQERMRMQTEAIVSPRRGATESASHGGYAATIRKNSMRVKWVLPDVKDIEWGPQIGSGATCAVFRAYYRPLKIDIAVKRYNSGFEESMHREGDVYMGLSTPICENIVPFIGLNEDPPLLIFRFARAGVLSSWIEQAAAGKPARLEKHRDSIILGIARAIAYLHAQKPPIMHRDLKSGNVLLDEVAVGVPPITWLTDFGEARNETDKTVTRGVGTVPWMAPEIADGQRHYSVKTDVYSFAMILYEMFCLQMPHANVQWAHEINERVARGERPTLTAPMPPRYEALYNACIVQQPAARPTMNQIVQYLEKATDDLNFMI